MGEVDKTLRGQSALPPMSAQMDMNREREGLEGMLAPETGGTLVRPEIETALKPVSHAARIRLCQNDNWSGQSDQQAADGEPRAVRWATRMLGRMLSPDWTQWHYTEGNGFFTACGVAVVPFLVDGSPEERQVVGVTCKRCLAKIKNTPSGQSVPGTNTYTLRLPQTFVHDHLDRLDGELGLWEVLRQDRNTITVRMDRQSLNSLKGDAEWYSDMRNHDADWPALVRSARRTLALCVDALNLTHANSQ